MMSEHLILLRRLADVHMNTFGDPEEAARILVAAAAHNPEFGLEAKLASLVAGMYAGTMDRSAILDDIQALASSIPSAKVSVPVKPRETGAPLRIGLISSQFCASPVGFLTLGALTSLSKLAKLYFFDRGAKIDWANEAFRAIAHRWAPCSTLEPALLLKLLLAADLDVLIDFGGWTDPVALAVLASRPARRQLKWVGGQSMTTGLHCFDGFITDGRQTPNAASSSYSEPLMRASHGYVSYTAPPYAPDLALATHVPPEPKGRPASGSVALVSNPAKISLQTAQIVTSLRPKRLMLIDRRWQHEQTRKAAATRLGPLMDIAEFIAPKDHPEYLETLRSTNALFVDTAPYSMGLTAIELRLLGKHVHLTPRSPKALMYERHAAAHMAAKRFDHHDSLAKQILQWCIA